MLKETPGFRKRVAWESGFFYDPGFKTRIYTLRFRVGIDEKESAGKVFFV